MLWLYSRIEQRQPYWMLIFIIYRHKSEFTTHVFFERHNIFLTITCTLSIRSIGICYHQHYSGFVFFLSTLATHHYYSYFHAGNVWIYRIYGDFNSDDPDNARYCHPTLYWFAFWITTASYIFAATLCCCICCCGLLASCFKAGSE